MLGRHLRVLVGRLGVLGCGFLGPWVTRSWMLREAIPGVRDVLLCAGRRPTELRIAESLAARKAIEPTQLVLRSARGGSKACDVTLSVAEAEDVALGPAGAEDVACLPSASS